jgi:hypothetical protein
VPSDDEIATDLGWVKLDPAKVEIVPGNTFGGNSEPPGERTVAQRTSITHTSVCARPGVGRPLILGVRRQGRTLDVGPRARTGINELTGNEKIERFLVKPQTLRLSVRGRRSADVGPFVPVEPQPVEVGKSCGNGLGANPRGIQILNS